ncbi:MAG: hypothetical protein ICV73_17115 [Acetobacteraceae bacterium]|nr:hypothetical protein [Acetobacteraceae bacterium]
MPAPAGALAMRLRFVLPVAAMLASAACHSPPELDVERQWGGAMRRLAMFGFYPATEDVQVGDLYLHAPPTDPSRRSVAHFSLLRVASLPRDAASLRRETRKGPNGGPAPRATYGVFDELRWQQTEDRMRVQAFGAPAAGGHEIGHADEEGAAVRLRRSAIPALTVGRISEAQLGAAGALGNLGARLGFGAAGRTAVHVSLRDVQELSLDAWRVSRQIEMHETYLQNRARVEDLLLHLRQLRPDLLGAACNGDMRAIDRGGVEILVITRVIYAGGIEHSFSRGAEAVVRLAADLQGSLPVGTRPPPRAPEAPAGGAASTAADASARLASLTADLDAAGGANRAGAATSFGLGTFGTLSLKTDFKRPVAVAAGSRVSYTFARALRGDYDTRPETSCLLERRRGYADAFCRQNGVSFSQEGLARVFRSSTGPCDPGKRASGPG